MWVRHKPETSAQAGEELYGGEQFDVQSACKNNEFKLKGYHSRKAIIVTWESESGGVLTLISNYGEHIQSDESGFYLV
ncbi:MAG: hypothetical protein COA42_22245 [Alteromonadaceae bacterium]|nr:MAG: hypothetical protein COA42_22245 [Alteromonadaceae bacterium]